MTFSITPPTHKHGPAIFQFIVNQAFPFFIGHIVKRVIPFYESTVVPDIKAGKRIIIAAHGNSLRALVKYLDNLTAEQIIKVNIPTGVPLVYEFDDDMKVVGKRYLGDQEALAAKEKAVADQAKKKA